MDTKTNKKFRVLIDGVRFLPYTYDSYYAASKAGENSIKGQNSYYEVVE